MESSQASLPNPQDQGLDIFLRDHEVRDFFQKVVQPQLSGKGDNMTFNEWFSDLDPWKTSGISCDYLISYLVKHNIKNFWKPLLEIPEFKNKQ